MTTRAIVAAGGRSIDGREGRRIMGERPAETEQAKGPARRLGPLDVLILAAWCGLAAGELEVAARVAQRSLSSTNRLYELTRHFVWLVPVINTLLFAFFGAVAPWWPGDGPGGRDGSACG